MKADFLIDQKQIKTVDATFIYVDPKGVELLEDSVDLSSSKWTYFLLGNMLMRKNSKGQEIKRFDLTPYRGRKVYGFKKSIFRASEVEDRLDPKTNQVGHDVLSVVDSDLEVYDDIYPLLEQIGTHDRSFELGQCVDSKAPWEITFKQVEFGGHMTIGGNHLLNADKNQLIYDLCGRRIVFEINAASYKWLGRMEKDGIMAHYDAVFNINSGKKNFINPDLVRWRWAIMFFKKMIDPESERNFEAIRKLVTQGKSGRPLAYSFVYGTSYSQMYVDKAHSNYKGFIIKGAIGTGLIVFWIGLQFLYSGVAGLKTGLFLPVTLAVNAVIFLTVQVRDIKASIDEEWQRISTVRQTDRENEARNSERQAAVEARRHARLEAQKAERLKALRRKEEAAESEPQKPISFEKPEPQKPKEDWAVSWAQRLIDENQAGDKMRNRRWSGYYRQQLEEIIQKRKAGELGDKEARKIIGEIDRDLEQGKINGRS